jgi:hypothetical protein
LRITLWRAERLLWAESVRLMSERALLRATKLLRRTKRRRRAKAGGATLRITLWRAERLLWAESIRLMSERALLWTTKLLTTLRTALLRAQFLAMTEGRSLRSWRLMVGTICSERDSQRR